MNESSCCSTSLPAVGVVGVLDFGHYKQYVVVFYICISLMIYDVELFFSYAYFLSRYLLGEMSAKVVGPHFNWVAFVFLLSLQSSLYILDNIPLLDTVFENIFSQSVICLLILLMLYF